MVALERLGEPSVTESMTNYGEMSIIKGGWGSRGPRGE